jgi:STE24 endopeptidase
MTTLPLYHQEGWSSSTTTNPDEATATPFLLYTVAFTTVVFLAEYWLDWRQLNRFSRNDGIPKELAEHVSSETFRKSIAYRRDQFAFKMVEGLFSFLLGTALVLAGYLPLLWDTAALLSTKSGLLDESSSTLRREALTTWVFVALMMVADAATSLPFSLYSTFAIEQRHGFNKSTLGLFLQDKLLTMGLGLGIAIPILPALVWIVRAGGNHFYLFVWLFLCVLSIVLMTIYPTFIAPLFNKYTPLEDGPAKTAIESLAKSVDFPLTQLFSVDGSRRSAHSNAYFYGFFKVCLVWLGDS